jgi:hypothetical protein
MGLTLDAVGRFFFCGAGAMWLTSPSSCARLPETRWERRGCMVERSVQGLQGEDREERKEEATYYQILIPPFKELIPYR